MLVELTPVVNFINVKCANFTYKSFFSSYILALNKLLYKKRARKMLMKLTPGSRGLQNRPRTGRRKNLWLEFVSRIWTSLHNLVKLCYGGLVLASSQFLLLP